MHAMAMLDRNYVYSGKKLHTGFDCSGLVSFVYKESAGLELRGSALDIANKTRPIPANQQRPATWFSSTPWDRPVRTWAFTLAQANLSMPPMSAPECGWTNSALIIGPSDWKAIAALYSDWAWQGKLLSDSSPQPVIASAAKQSIFACQSTTYESPRRCAPRDGRLRQTSPRNANFIKIPIIKINTISVTIQALFVSTKWVLTGTKSNPGHCNSAKPGPTPATKTARPSPFGLFRLIEY